MVKLLREWNFLLCVIRLIDIDDQWALVEVDFPDPSIFSDTCGFRGYGVAVTTFFLPFPYPPSIIHSLQTPLRYALSEVTHQVKEQFKTKTREIIDNTILKYFGDVRVTEFVTADFHNLNFFPLDLPPDGSEVKFSQIAYLNYISGTQNIIYEVELHWGVNIFWKREVNGLVELNKLYSLFQKAFNELYDEGKRELPSAVGIYEKEFNKVVPKLIDQIERTEKLHENIRPRPVKLTPQKTRETQRKTLIYTFEESTHPTGQGKGKMVETKTYAMFLPKHFVPIFQQKMSGVGKGIDGMVKALQNVVFFSSVSREVETSDDREFFQFYLRLVELAPVNF